MEPMSLRDWEEGDLRLLEASMGDPVMTRYLGGPEAPEQIVASHSTSGKVDRTRPLCAYPKVAQYKGSGSIDDAANFVCK